MICRIARVSHRLRTAKIQSTIGNTGHLQATIGVDTYWSVRWLERRRLVLSGNGRPRPPLSFHWRNLDWGEYATPLFEVFPALGLQIVRGPEAHLTTNWWPP